MTVTEFVDRTSTLWLFEHRRREETSLHMNTEPTTDDLWDAALVKAGFVDKRDGESPSHRALAEHLGIGTSTITNIRAGNAKPKPATVAKIADALRIDVRELSRWIGQTREVAKPYTPPSEADLLDQRERDALDEIIRVMAASKKRPVKDETLTTANQPTAVDASQDDYILAARKGETQERRRRRLEGDFEDHPQDEGPEFGA